MFGSLGLFGLFGVSGVSGTSVLPESPEPFSTDETIVCFIIFEVLVFIGSLDSWFSCNSWSGSFTVALFSISVSLVTYPAFAVIFILTVSLYGTHTHKSVSGKAFPLSSVFL